MTALINTAKRKSHASPDIMATAQKLEKRKQKGVGDRSRVAVVKLCRKLSVCGAMQVAGGADATQEMLLRSEGPVVVGKIGSCRAQRDMG